MINLMKASAGTGKTYNLAKTYLTLLFQKDESGRTDPYAYRHILAVTFTNKATDEMKCRILKELHTLALEPASSAYYSSFVPAVFPDAEALRSSASVVLSNILHDYGAFAVSTIDRFFQQTLKAFSREIGQMASYQIDLNRDQLIKESVDRMLDSLSEETPELLDWLSECVSAQLEEGSRYNLDKILLNMGKRLKSEQRRAVIDRYGIDEKTAVSRLSLKKTAAALRKIVVDFRKGVADDAQRALSVFRDNGFDPHVTSRSWLDAIKKYTDGKYCDQPSATFLANAFDYSKWFTKKDQNSMQGMESVLLEPVSRFASHFSGDGWMTYCTALRLRKNIHAMGVAADFFSEFNALLKEKNELCLDESNLLLKDIIDGSDAPFIYEKTGVRFDHFLLDEFQDTSRVQWDNFRPLLEESVSRQNDNLIVGDVKQSIYRFRNSDWKLMAYDVPESFSDLNMTTLEVNFRSRPNLVRFNHDFFSWLSGGLGLSELYKDVSSKANKEGEGFVKFMPIGPDSEEDAQENAVVDEIRRLKGEGADYGDITVLVRKNKFGISLSARLIEEGIPVISDESLTVKSSSIVRRIVSLMERTVQPEDAFTKYMAEHLGVVDAPQDSLSLVDFAETISRDLMKTYPDVFKKESAYLRAFMDRVVEYVKNNGNSLSGFLEMWKEDNSSIASPSGSDAVRVMTVHKSKGLEFRYVIFPYADAFCLFDSKNTSMWSHMSGESPVLKQLDDNVYDVAYSDKLEDTYFKDAYHEEIEQQKVDSINAFYVALTRASEGMTIITGLPKKPSGKDMGQLLNTWVEQEGANVGFKAEDGAYVLGRLDADAFAKKDQGDPAATMESDYPSFALGDRLKCGAQVEDFFDGEGNTGYSASERLKGIIMHEILASVIRPSDLDGAVDARVRDGILKESEAEEVRTLLRNRIESVMDKGWFPEDVTLVSNEESVVGTDGIVCRPDRVVYDGADGVTIIDYKFGKELPAHRAQVKEYADVFREMGFKNVKTALWYVMTENIIFA